MSWGVSPCAGPTGGGYLMVQENERRGGEKKEEVTRGEMNFLFQQYKVRYMSKSERERCKKKGGPSEI